MQVDTRTLTGTILMFRPNEIAFQILILKKVIIKPSPITILSYTLNLHDCLIGIES